MESKYDILKKFLVREIKILREADDEDIPDDDIEDEEPGEDEPEDVPAENPPPETTEPNVFSADVDQMADIIRNTKGRVFKVEFVKRTNGEDRVLLGRIGIKAYLHGGVLPYDPDEKRLIPCFDVQKRDYRMIAIEGIKSLKFQNKIYVLG